MIAGGKLGTVYFSEITAMRGAEDKGASWAQHEVRFPNVLCPSIIDI